MKWKPRPQPKSGARRIRTFFALFPVDCPSTEEWRWLEWVTVEEVYWGLQWYMLRFIDEPQETDPKPL